MSGTLSGGIKARNTNLAKYGENFYKNIGRLGGTAKCSKPKGFASPNVDKNGLTGNERAKLAGYRGGRVSRRSKKPQSH